MYQSPYQNSRSTSSGHRLRKRPLFESHRSFAVFVCLGITVVLAIVSLFVGSSELDSSTVFSSLFGVGDPKSVAIVQQIRLPHVLVAIIGGIALGSAGCVFQSSLANPLASPSTLGIAQSASFGASLAIIVFGAGQVGAHEGLVFGNVGVIAICAFVFSLASMLIVLGISRIRSLTPESIVLAGVAISTLFSGATALVQYFALDSQVSAVVFWTFGSLRRCGYPEIVLMLIVVVPCMVFLIWNRWRYNALESGDSSASSLGVNVSRVRFFSLLVATLSASVVIAFCGTINFIGLIAPHIMRKLIGGDYRFLLPASAFMGACVLLVSDLIAANALPGVILPISTITSFVGAPLLVVMLLKGSSR